MEPQTFIGLDLAAGPDATAILYRPLSAEGRHEQELWAVAMRRVSETARLLGDLG